MDELKPGYRPDTVLIQNLPLKWFGGNSLKTNWLISVFSTFGDIRRFHIPLLDEIEKEKSTVSDENGFKKFNFNSEHSTFDVYLMYKDYVGFVNAMDALRGKKLIKCVPASKSYNKELFEYEIKIDFDKTKHLSDKAIRRRQIAKKYGINTLEDLNEYKKKAKERKILFEERKKQLKKQKKSSKNLLNYLVRLVEVDQKKQAEEEIQRLNERLLKERLIEEEKKLRNKLIERQRALMLEKSAKERDELINKEPDLNNQPSFDNSNHRSYANQNNLKYLNDHYSNKYENSNYSNQSKNSEFIFKDSRIHSHFKSHLNSEFVQHPRFTPNKEYYDNNYNNHQTNSFQRSNTFPKLPNSNLKVRHQFNPYQTNNRNTFSYNNKKSNFNDNSNYQNRSNYQDKFDYRDKTDYQNRSNDYQNRSNDKDRSNSYQNSYQNNYQNRTDYEERSNSHSDRSSYQNNYHDKLNQNDKFHNKQFSRPFNKTYDESYDRSYDKSYDRSYDEPYDKPYDKPYNRPFKSNRYDNERNDQSDEEKSNRPKSFVVLCQK